MSYAIGPQWVQFACDSPGFVDTHRLKVDGGWLYRVTVFKPGSNDTEAAGLAFVPQAEA